MLHPAERTRAYPYSIHPDLGNNQLRSVTGRDTARDWVWIPILSTFLGTRLSCLWHSACSAFERFHVQATFPHSGRLVI